jgi:DNA topoisomerase-6 subunit B
VPKNASALPAPAKEPKTSKAAKAAAVDDDAVVETPDRKMPRQREIAVSEFFSKNRHLLGFDSPQKALLTAIREAVDNALDACEEARIFPEIVVELEELEPPAQGASSSRYRVRIEDNGPGIPKPEIGKIFAKLLYGSKFHRLKQSRGQQGIGISAAVMYGQMTTGEPSTVVSKMKGSRANKVRLFIDTAKNAPKIDAEGVDDSDAWKQKVSGTSIEILLIGQYKGGRHGVEAYLKQTGLANPHARVVFRYTKAASRSATKPTPSSTETHDMPRVVNELPKEPIEIKPHPHGVELGTLQRMLEMAGKQGVAAFLSSSFSRVPQTVANDIVTNAGLDPVRASSSLSRPEAEQVYKSLQAQKLMAPPTSCLSPIGEPALIKGLYALFGDASALQDDDDLEHLAPEKPQGPKALLSADAMQQAAAGTLSTAAAEAAKSEGKASKGKAAKKKPQGDLFAATTPPSAASTLPAPATTTTLPQDASTLPSPSAAAVEKVKIEKDEEGADVLVLGENVFVTAVTRPPAIYRGNPFQVECGILYSKELRSDELAKVFRFANRVPLLYQASACAMTKAVISAPWRSYEVQQSKGALPTGPLVILVHIASAWVPYTSESKEAIAHYPEVLKEMRLAIMEAGRRLQRFLRRRRREVDEQKKRDYITKYLDTIGEALQEILGLSSAERDRTTENLKVVLEKSRAQSVSDDERKRKRKGGEAAA